MATSAKPAPAPRQRKPETSTLVNAVLIGLALEGEKNRKVRAAFVRTIVEYFPGEVLMAIEAAKPPVES